MSTATPVPGSVAGRVVVVAGAAGAAGPPLVARLAAAGATVVAADASAERLEPVVAQGNAAAADGGTVHAAVVDLLDEQATLDWAGSVLAEFGRVDGLVHLVGGWRGGAAITESDLADWTLLQDLLVRTLQHTSRAFHDSLKASDDARLVLISTVQAQAPSATNASYAAAKAAAEAWTLAVADSFRGSNAAAVILPIKALLTPAMREAKPQAKFSGYTEVSTLADTIHDLWLTPATELNGRRVAVTD